MRVLILEAGERRAQLLRQAVADHGFVADVCRSAEHGHDIAARNENDVVVLAGDFSNAAAPCVVVKKLRERGTIVPIIVYFEENLPGHAVRVLEAGADTCLTAPWKDPEHLVAQIRALLQRNRKTSNHREPPTILRVADIEMDLGRRSVRRGGQRIDLTRKEFELLHLLITNADRVMSRTSIGVRVWGEYWDRESNVIDVCISNLRKKIENGFDNPLIRTVRGSGYILSSELDEEDKVSSGTRSRNLSR